MRRNKIALSDASAGQRAAGARQLTVRRELAAAAQARSELGAPIVEVNSQASGFHVDCLPAMSPLGGQTWQR